MTFNKIIELNNRNKENFKKSYGGTIGEGFIYKCYKKDSFIILKNKTGNNTIKILFSYDLIDFFSNNLNNIINVSLLKNFEFPYYIHLELYYVLRKYILKNKYENLIFREFENLELLISKLALISGNVLMCNESLVIFSKKNTVYVCTDTCFQIPPHVMSKLKEIIYVRGCCNEI